MKRKERRHLKENELAQTIRNVRGFLDARERQLTGIFVVVFLIAVSIGGITLIRQRAEGRAEAALAEAMVALNARVVPATAKAEQPGELPPAASIGATGTFLTEEAKLAAAVPKLKAAADGYPDTEPGIQARYHLASTLAFLGKHQEAAQAFEEVERRAGTSSLYGRMARLGQADAQMKAGQIDAAIATWKALAASNPEDVPQDAVLMELARAYAAKGDRQEAEKAFTQLVDEHPDSPYVTEARQELATLKG